jgi:hypothetical protein
MKRILFVTLLYFATSAAFAADLKPTKDHGDNGSPCADKANMPDQKARPKGNPPTKADIDSLPKTTVVSKDSHEAPPEQGTSVEQPE